MLEVLEAGGLVTLQDAGRTGWRRYGVPASGPMDPLAFQAANLLAGNPPEAVAVEIGGGDVVLQAGYDCVIAVAGAGYDLSVSIWDFPLWGSYFVRGGWTIRLSKSGPGMWVYLALSGGIKVEPVLGSGATYLRGHFGGLEGRMLQPGDILQPAVYSQAIIELAARTLKESARPAYSETPTLEVILGPQADRFEPESLETFLSCPYQVSTASDRMGYRFEGPLLKHTRGADLTSEGLMPGCVQVPSDGRPIVMMADCATAGGYPKIASVVRADLPLLAQCRPGRDRVRFRQTSVEAAQARYRSLMENLKTGIVGEEERFASSV